MGNISRLAAVFSFAAVSVADICNPLNTKCPPNVGLANSTYAIDFTQQTSIPPDWTLSNWANIKFGSKGAEFTVAKRFDSPQLWTNFYIHYGKTEVVAQVAPGTGIVSSAVLMSDTLDEIDWEWSGNNFGDTVSKGQNNYYGKGITGNYDRGSFFNVASPQTQFHTYTVDWTPIALTWSVDGTVVRTFRASDADSGSHQYPQSPAKFQLGIWAGGDPGNAWGTVDWAGGYTDFTKAPFTMYVKSVKITNYNPAYAYNYTDNSGSSNSIKYLSKPVVSPSSSSTQTKITSSTSTPAKASTTCAGVPPSAPTQNGIVSGCTKWYTAESGDTCLTISAKFNISNAQFMAWNPAVDPPLCYNMWLNYGYCVSTDCSLVSTSSTVVSTTSSTSSSRSTFVTTATSSVSTIVVSSTSVPTTTIGPTSNASTSRSSSSSSSSSTTSQVLSSVIISRSSTSTSTSRTSSPSLPSSSQSTTVRSSSTTSSPTSSDTLCPSTDGQSIMNRDSNVYAINCNSDSNQGSYAVTHALHSYLDCLNLCDEAASTGCTAFTYVGSAKGDGAGICYLKSASGTFIPAADNYISGALSANSSTGSSTTQAGSSVSSRSTTQAVSSTSSRPVTSSTVAATSSFSMPPLVSPAAELCPDAETQTFVTSQGGSTFFMRCSSDTNYGSYSNSVASTSWKDCMNSCDSDARCVAFTYVGGNKGIGSGVCWFKDNKGQAVTAGADHVAGFLVIKGLPPGSTTSSAPTSWATNSAGTNYTIYRNSDTNYGAYANVQATTSFLDCTTACDKDPKCKAWTFIGAREGKGSGTCWLKSQLGQPVPSNDNGVISGSRLTQGVRMRRAVSSWWNSVTSVKTTATKTQRVATTIPKAPPHPAWARYYPHGGRWMWNGHGDWEWAWN